MCANPSRAWRAGDSDRHRDVRPRPRSRPRALDPARMIVAAVPVKDLVNAKQRLIPVLDGRQRAELARAMLSDVLRTLTAAGLDGVWVITRDQHAAAVAASFGAEILHEPDNRGHTLAVAFAQREAVRRRVDIFLTVPGD